MRNTILATVVASTLVLSGCATNGQGPNQVGGSLIGAAVGGLVGAQFGKGSGQLVGVAIGALAGAALGGHIGQQMDASDVRTVGHVLETQPTGATATWNNPDTGRRYEATPTRTIQLDSGKYCREFHIHDATVGGNQRQQVYGTACRQPDGTWELVQSR